MPEKGAEMIAAVMTTMTRGEEKSEMADGTPPR